ncbi:MAG TPA: hypothetical protein PLL20_06200 [Phycisphaerae bacterium]|nr:hypothetical protein [Phycisphaerae bacterium]
MFTIHPAGASVGRLSSCLVVLPVLTITIGCTTGPNGLDVDRAWREAEVARRGACEPNADIACAWWPDLRDIWTPVGWKDHAFRFNVLFNGTILAQPDMNPRTQKWKNQGVQLAFEPSYDGKWRNYGYIHRDDTMVRQCWNEAHAAPIVRSEWTQHGLSLRQEVFGHVPGGKRLTSGTEPIFAWVRLSIASICPGVPAEKNHTFLIKLNAPHISAGMTYMNNIQFHLDRSAYPRRLTAEPAGDGWRLLEEGGKVRLGVARGRPVEINFTPGKPTEKDSLIALTMEVKPGNHVDVLVPMLPTEREVFDAELMLGLEGALAEADAFWAIVPATAAVVDTPEALVNNTIKHSIRLAEMISEINPSNGLPTFLSGSLEYTYLWPTPGAMACTMLLDAMGYHDSVAAHLEQFRVGQGQFKPPGDLFEKHPGYLSASTGLSAIDWLSDHGAILYSVAEHSLMTGDEEFTRRWLPAIEKACDFIKDARRMQGHKGVPGVMPPAVATDMQTQIQGLWNDGWMYKGLTSAVKVLRLAGHPRTEEFAAEARDYQRTFVAALRAKAAEMPTWTDCKGKTHRMVPAALGGATEVDPRHPFYLDTGPLFLVFSGFVDARDELAREAIAWFREGPQLAMLREEPLYEQMPGLRHEMSSWEPCYSWNVFHSHAMNERYQFLEGMYSLYAGSVSRETFVSCESRGGITGNVFSAPLAIYLSRLAIIDDQIEPEALHLLRIMPRAWLRTDRETRFEKMPTAFGPVTVKARINREGKMLEVTYRASFRRPPQKVLLHVPPVPGLKAVRVNGKPVAWDGRSGSIELVPSLTGEKVIP